MEHSKNPAAIITASSRRANLWHPFSQEQTASEPIEIVRGEGIRVFDSEGNEYLDLISSWWVNLHGHAHPTIAAAIAKQATELEHIIFAGFTHPPARNLARRLCELLPARLERVFFSECGSAAVEIGLKMAIQYWHNRGEQRHRILAFQNGYHGDTFGAMAAGKASNFFAPFEEMMFSVTHVPYANTWIDDEGIESKEAAALEQFTAALSEHAHEIAVVIVEPLVQGAGGMNTCRPEFISRIVELAHEADVLVMFDEVMTGFGRTGTMFACQQTTVPDIICLAKGLTGGFSPLAVTVASEKIYEAFLGDKFSMAFAHGHSYTANPLGCAAALASLDVFENENTLERIKAIEKVHQQQIGNIAAAVPIERPRVVGTIAAFEMPDDSPGYEAAIGGRLKKAFLDKGLIIRPLGNTVYLMPPYCISDAELEAVYESVAEVCRDCLAG